MLNNYMCINDTHPGQDSRVENLLSALAVQSPIYHVHIIHLDGVRS